MRRFIVVGQRARTARDFPLDDICGAGGRWDLLARCVQAGLFVSHDLRADTELVLVALGPPDPPKAVRVSGGEVRRLNPDERSTVALLSKGLEMDLPMSGLEVDSTPGVHVSRRDLAATLDGSEVGTLVLLDEAGSVDCQDLPGLVDAEAVTMVVGDDRGLTPEQLSEVRSRGAMEAQLGPVSLHADHCITIVHNILDRAVR